MASYKGYQKPLSGQKIDWTHPLARGLTACYAAQPGNILLRDLTGNRQNDLINNNGVALINTVSPQQYPWDVLTTAYPQSGNVGNSMNPSALFVSGSSQYLSGTGQGLHTGNIDWTLYFWVNPTSIAAQMMFAANVGAANADREFQLYSVGSGSDWSGVKCDWWIDGAGHVGSVNTPGTFLTVGHWCTWFLWHDAGSGTINLQGYDPEIAGNVGTIYSAAAVGGNSGAGTFTLGKQGDVGGLYLSGIMDNVQVRKRVLSQDERTYLARNPYCFFNESPILRRYYAAPSAPVAVSRSFAAIIG